MLTNYAEKNKARAAIKERMHREGTWPQYVKARAHFQAEPINCPKGIAWQVAAYLFQSKDGSPPEIPLDGEMGVFLKKYADFPLENLPPPAPFNANNPKVVDTRPEKMPPTPVREKIAADIKESKQIFHSDWDSLKANVDNTRTADMAEVALWVARSSGRPAKDISPDEVPDRMAVFFLKMLAANQANEVEFARTFLAKLIPDRRQLEHAARFQDDGREQLELLERFEEDFEHEMSEEAA